MTMPPDQGLGERETTMFHAQKKSMLLAYVIWFFLGGLGIHRFYLGATTSAVWMLGICVASFVLSFVFIGFLGYIVIGVWWVIDLFLIPGLAKAFNDNLSAMLRQQTFR